MVGLMLSEAFKKISLLTIYKIARIDIREVMPSIPKIYVSLNSLSLPYFNPECSL